MGTDGVATLDALTARREILDGLIAAHGGRITNSAGDSVLAAALLMRSDVPWRLQRVHVGDVMIRARDLFSNGVNIAARLQTLARAGGLCIAGVS
jgi:class 3 adenylate cyclase